jgi:hypothetical protein
MRSPAVLLAEPDNSFAAVLAERTNGWADMHRHGHFDGARRELLAAPFEFVVANLRLRGFNGLHLVHLAATLTVPPIAVVYTDEYDVGLAREIQRTGAFFEIRACMPQALKAYLRGTLPTIDRRDPAARDRRRAPRGGRRCWDQPDGAA